MIKTTLNWTIKNLKSMHDNKETLCFDHPIQRQSSQWNNLQQSLLVHSILANFPVPAIYVEKNNSDEMDDKGKPVFKYSVLDNKYGRYEYASISADEVMEYSSHIKGNYSQDQQEILLSAINFLDESFDSKEKLLKKINIPMAIMMADLALEKDITPYDFHNWFLYFFVVRKSEYGQYCSSGSIKKEKVFGRIETMTNHFYEHFHLESEDTTIEDNADDQEELLADEQADETTDTIESLKEDSTDISPDMDISEEIASEESIDDSDDSLLEQGAFDYGEASHEELLMVSE